MTMRRHYLAGFMAMLFLSSGQVIGADSGNPMTTSANAERGVTRESTYLKTTTIGLGSEVVQLEGEIDEWTLLSSLRIAPAQFIERDGLAEGVEAKDWSVLGGAALAWVKGDEAISISFLGTLDSFDDFDRIDYGAWEANNSSEHNYYYADLRYHRIMSDNLSLFIGYKVGDIEWDWEQHEIGGTYYYKEDGRAIGHGPVVGANIFSDVKDTPLSVYGSVAAMPIGLVHKSVDINDDGVKSSRSDTDPAWFVNPELGLRWRMSKTSSLSLSWFWHLMGDYTGGSGEMLHGLSGSVTIRF